jgi:manganese/iron transport system permease protein
MDKLIEAFHYSFLQNAALAAVLIGVTCAVLGVYVVQRRMAFIGDAMAHTTLPGLVIAHLSGWSLSLGGLAAAFLTALLIAWVSRRQRVAEDTAIGVVFAGMFAVGVLLMSRARSYRDLSHMLFGNVLGVTPAELWLIAGVTLVVLLVLTIFHKEIELTSYDSTHARVIGIPAEGLRLILLGLLALAVVTGIQAVGVILTNALLVTPAATASLLSNRLPARMVIAAVVAAVAALMGLAASFLIEASSGASIVLACTGIFVVCAMGTSLAKPFQSQMDRL